MNSPKHERLAEFFRRLESAPALSSFEAAFELVCKTINEVEDEITTISFDETISQDLSRTDGRMYPPLMDSIRDVQDRNDVKRFPTRGHNQLIRENGAIQIWDRTKSIQLCEKRGADGEGIYRS